MVSHSPILLGLPGAQDRSFHDDREVHPCAYEETESYQVMEMFINSRELLLKAFERFIKKFIKYPLLFLLKEVYHSQYKKMNKYSK